MKKLLSLMLVIALMMSLCSLAVFAQSTDDQANATPAFERGDADGDGKLTVLDATHIQRYKARLIYQTGIDLLSADANMDGVVSVADATRIQRVMADLCDIDGVPLGEESRFRVLSSEKVRPQGWDDEVCQIIRSIDDFDSFCTEMEHNLDSSEIFPAWRALKERLFDERFFEEYALVGALLNTGCSGDSAVTLESVTSDASDAIRLGVRIDIPKNPTPDMTSQLMLIRLRKEAVENKHVVEVDYTRTTKPENWRHNALLTAIPGSYRFGVSADPYWSALEAVPFSKSDASHQECWTGELTDDLDYQNGARGFITVLDSADAVFDFDEKCNVDPTFFEEGGALLAIGVIEGCGGFELDVTRLLKDEDTLYVELADPFAVDDGRVYWEAFSVTYVYEKIKKSDLHNIRNIKLISGETNPSAFLKETFNHETLSRTAPVMPDGGAIDFVPLGTYNQIAKKDVYPGEKDTVFLIRSKEEYKAAFKTSNPAYNDEFFRTNALVCSVIEMFDHQTSAFINGIHTSGNTLFVLTNGVAYGNSEPTAPVWHVIAKVSQEDIKDVTTITPALPRDSDKT